MKISVTHSTKDYHWHREPIYTAPQRRSLVPAWLAFAWHFMNMRRKVRAGNYHPTFPITLEWRWKRWKETRVRS